MAIVVFYVIASWISFWILYIGTFLFYILKSVICYFTSSVYNVIENIIYCNSLIFSIAIDIINYNYAINFMNYSFTSFTSFTDGWQELSFYECMLFLFNVLGKISLIFPSLINYLINLFISLMKVLVPLLYYQIRELYSYRFKFIVILNYIFKAILYYIYNNWFKIFCAIFYFVIRTNSAYSMCWFPGEFMEAHWLACNHSPKDLWRHLEHFCEYEFEFIEAYPVLDSLGRNAFNDHGE